MNQYDILVIFIKALNNVNRIRIVSTTESKLRVRGRADLIESIVQDACSENGLVCGITRWKDEIGSKVKFDIYVENDENYESELVLEISVLE